MERSAPSREARLLTCGDLSTRSRTLSLKVTRGDDSEGGASPTLLPDYQRIWRSSGRAGAALSLRAYGTHRGVPGFALCLHRPTRNALRSAQCYAGQPSRYTVLVHLSTPRNRPPACHRRVAALQSASARPRRWCDAREPPSGRRLRRPALREVFDPDSDPVPVPVPDAATGSAAATSASDQLQRPTAAAASHPRRLSPRFHAGSVPGSLFVRRKGAWHRSHRVSI
jgi:hypothetical protein